MVVTYYSDNACLSPTSSTSFTGPAPIAAGTYTSTNQSSYYLCSEYSGGCAGLFIAATKTAPQAAALKFTYYFSNSGASSSSSCMYNISKGYEVFGNYESTPTACTNSNQCGYSQAYTNTTLGLPFISTNTNFSCYLIDAATSNLSCWGTGTSGQIGNATNSNESIPALAIGT